MEKTLRNVMFAVYCQWHLSLNSSTCNTSPVRVPTYMNSSLSSIICEGQREICYMLALASFMILLQEQSMVEILWLRIEVGAVVINVIPHTDGSVSFFQCHKNPGTACDSRHPLSTQRASCRPL